MKKDFKLDVIVYSDSGAVGFYWPVPLKNACSPLIAFLHKGCPSNKLLMELNSKNSSWVIENKDFIDGILKYKIEEDCCPPSEYLKKIADLYAVMKYKREDVLKDEIAFKKIPEIVTPEFLMQLMYSYLGIYTDENLEIENSAPIFELCSAMAYRNWGPGLFAMAVCYFKGIGTKKSKDKFVKYVKKSCDQGFEIALNTMKNIDKYLETFLI